MTHAIHCGLSTRAAEGDTLVVRPTRTLFRQGLGTALAVMTPIFAVLYWLTITNGLWPIVLIANGVGLVFMGLIALPFVVASIRISSAGIRERGFLGHLTQTPADRVGSVLTVEVYRDSALDTQRQLFVCDRDGALATRMRGAFWSRSDMDAIIDVLAAQNVPIDVVETPMAMADLRRMRPELLYWFERLPTFRGRTTT